MSKGGGWLHVGDGPTRNIHEDPVMLGPAVKM